MKEEASKRGSTYPHTQRLRSRFTKAFPPGSLSPGVVVLLKRLQEPVDGSDFVSLGGGSISISKTGIHQVGNGNVCK
jgi:hypothetical protein